MAKITSVKQKVFGTNAGAKGITEYGSPASGTPVYSTDATAIQTASWSDGWAAAALAGGEIPTFQDFNAIHYVLSTNLAALQQDGIIDYDSTTEYYQFSITRKAGTYELYGSLINANVGNALPAQVSDLNWLYLGDLSTLVKTQRIEIYSGFHSTPFSDELPLDSSTVAKTSGATFTGIQYKNVYTYLWDNVADAQASVAGGRGASASADFDADKAITLPDFSDRAAIGVGASIPVVAGVAGATGATIAGTVGPNGATSTTIAQMPAHTHDLVALTTGAPLPGISATASSATPLTLTTESEGGGLSHTHTVGAFTGTPISVLQKSIGVYWYIKF